MQKHLQHYGYFTGKCSPRGWSTRDVLRVDVGRSEAVKKYGFVPSKAVISSSDGEDSSSDDEEQGKLSAAFPLTVKYPCAPQRMEAVVRLRAILVGCDARAHTHCDFDLHRVRNLH